jgi:hypothetical protein
LSASALFVAAVARRSGASERQRGSRTARITRPASRNAVQAAFFRDPERSRFSSVDEEIASSPSSSKAVMCSPRALRCPAPAGTGDGAVKTLRVLRRERPRAAAPVRP